MPIKVQINQNNGLVQSQQSSISNVLEIEGKVSTSGFSFRSGSTNTLIFVNQKSDFPTSTNGVIQLDDNATYFICDEVDLAGDRLVGGANTTLLGGSSENCKIKSTGLTGQPLISTSYSMPMRNFSIESDWGFRVTGNTTDTAIDIFGVNFLSCSSAATIGDCANLTMLSCAFLDSGKVEFSGSAGTIAFTQCLFRTKTNNTSIILTPSANISRRLRVIYSSFITVSGSTSISASLDATIPNESLILDTVNFSGNGTYISGITQTSNKSLFVNCVGIVNTAVNGQLYMNNNNTATTISSSNTFYKVAGTTTPSDQNSKYLHQNNRLTCDAAIKRKYFVHCTLSFSAGNSNVCEFGFYDSNLGGIRTPSRTKSTANTAGRAENVSLMCVVEHQNSDYVELHCSNTSATTNITVTDMNLVITQIQ